jgi:endonuclease III
VSVKAERAKTLVKGLRKLYPDAHCELDYSNPLELLVATILSAQCTDVRVNKTTKALFKRYSPKAVETIDVALQKDTMDEIWARRRNNMRKAKA